tara:strand:- start:1173 stop:1358 length:186 start_codon:yes stop_codon:yes gene_type:complete
MALQSYLERKNHNVANKSTKTNIIDLIQKVKISRKKEKRHTFFYTTLSATILLIISYIIFK